MMWLSKRSATSWLVFAMYGLPNHSIQCTNIFVGTYHIPNCWVPAWNPAWTPSKIVWQLKSISNVWVFGHFLVLNRYSFCHFSGKLAVSQIFLYRLWVQIMRVGLFGEIQHVCTYIKELHCNCSCNLATSLLKCFIRAWNKNDTLVLFSNWAIKVGNPHLLGSVTEVQFLIQMWGWVLWVRYGKQNVPYDRYEQRGKSLIGIV